MQNSLSERKIIICPVCLV